VPLNLLVLSILLFEHKSLSCNQGHTWQLPRYVNFSTFSPFPSTEFSFLLLLNRPYHWFVLSLFSSNPYRFPSSFNWFTNVSKFSFVFFNHDYVVCKFQISQNLTLWTEMPSSSLGFHPLLFLDEWWYDTTSSYLVPLLAWNHSPISLFYGCSCIFTFVFRWCNQSTVRVIKIHPATLRWTLSNTVKSRCNAGARRLYASHQTRNVFHVNNTDGSTSTLLFRESYQHLEQHGRGRSEHTAQLTSIVWLPYSFLLLIMQPCYVCCQFAEMHLYSVHCCQWCIVFIEASICEGGLGSRNSVRPSHTWLWQN